MGKFFRVLGWLITISISASGVIVLYLFGLATFPFGITLWLAAYAWGMITIATYKAILESLDKSSMKKKREEEIQRKKVMNLNLVVNDDEPKE